MRDARRDHRHRDDQRADPGPVPCGVPVVDPVARHVESYHQASGVLAHPLVRLLPLVVVVPGCRFGVWLHGVVDHRYEIDDPLLEPSSLPGRAGLVLSHRPLLDTPSVSTSPPSTSVPAPVSASPPSWLMSISTSISDSRPVYAVATIRHAAVQERPAEHEQLGRAPAPDRLLPPCRDESPLDERGSPLGAHDPDRIHRPEIDTQSDTLRSGRPRDSWTPSEAKVREFFSKMHRWTPLDAGGQAGTELLIRVSLVRSQRGPPIESTTHRAPPDRAPGD